MIVYLTNATLYSRAGCPQPAGHLLGAIARKGNQIPQKNALRRCDAKHHRRLEGKPPYSEILRFTNLNDHLHVDRRSNEPGGPNGVTIIAAAKARNCQLITARINGHYLK